MLKITVQASSVTWDNIIIFLAIAFKNIFSVVTFVVTFAYVWMDDFQRAIHKSRHNAIGLRILMLKVRWNSDL